MARMSIDDKVSRDPRITMLAAELGWSRRETVGCLVMDVWPIAYDQETPDISERVIDTAAGCPGFAASLITCELATRTRGGKVRISGAAERIAYLDRKREAGREGGLKSAESRRNKSKQTGSTPSSKPEASGNPPDPVPSPSPSPAPDPVPAPDPALSDSAKPTQPAPTGAADKGRRKSALPSGWEPERTESILAEQRAAQARGVDVGIELRKLTDWAAANNAKKADWNATWRNWLRNAKGSATQFKSRAQNQFDLQMQRVAQLEADEARKEPE